MIRLIITKIIIVKSATTTTSDEEEEDDENKIGGDRPYRILLRIAIAEDYDSDIKLLKETY